MTSTVAVSTKTRRLRHLLLVAIGQEQIGALIKRAREDADLTQAELADAIGLKNGAQSISRYERAETEVPIKRLRRIAEATAKPMSFFIQEPEDTVPEHPWLALLRAELEAEVERLRGLNDALEAELGPARPDRKRSGQ